MADQNETSPIPQSAPEKPVLDDPVAQAKILLKKIKEEEKKGGTKKAALSEYTAMETDDLRLRGVLSDRVLERIREQDYKTFADTLNTKTWESRVPSLRDRLSKVFK